MTIEFKKQLKVPEETVEKRVRDFREVESGYTREQAMAEASRCLRCDYRGEQEMKLASSDEE